MIAPLNTTSLNDLRISCKYLKKNKITDPYSLNKPISIEMKLLQNQTYSLSYRLPQDFGVYEITIVNKLAE